MSSISTVRNVEHELSLILPTRHMDSDKYVSSEIIEDAISILQDSVDEQASTVKPTFIRSVSEHFSGKLQRYFRIHDPEDPNPAFRGWRKAVIAAAAASAAILLINLLFTVVISVKFGAVDGIGEIYRGDCGVVKRWNTTLHLLINIFSTALLAASSFTLQCIGSPTRSEVDAAHQKRTSLDIGLLSFKNILHIKPWRRLVWVILCLSTVPLHLLWNSAVFSTIGTNRFAYVVATSGFLSGASYDMPTTSWKCDSVDKPVPGDLGFASIIEEILQGQKNGEYSLLSSAECLDLYSSNYLYSRRNLILLVQHPESTNKTFPMGSCGYSNTSYTSSSPTWNGSSLIAINENISPGLDWLNNVFADSDMDLLAQKLSASVYKYWNLGNYSVESCWSDTASHCQLQFSPYILYAVIACNLLKLICMCITARYLWSLDEPILATVGDAVASFLETPDPTTKGYCLLNSRDLRAGVWSRVEAPRTYDHTYSFERSRRLYSGTSRMRWWLTMSLCMTYFLAGTILWLRSISLTSYSLANLMGMPLGAVDQDLILGIGGDSSANLIQNVLIANSFQLASSITYFLYNSLWTAQCGALEWASYVQRQKALRVTWPKGQQKSTYYLQLPYRYGIPLTIVLVVLHFLISQSVFVARLRYWNWDGSPGTGGFSDVGFSPRAIFFACLAIMITLILQVGFASRFLNDRIPIHGNQSAAISAACHPPNKADALDSTPAPCEDNDMKATVIATELVIWGETKKPVEIWDRNSAEEELIYEEAGHCGFSTSFVDLPTTGQSYR